VPIVDDNTLNESNQTFYVHLNTITSGNAMLGQNQGTGTINEDGDVSTVSISDAQASEQSPGNVLTFSVELAAASSQTVTVAYTTQDDTAKAGVDYTPVSGTVTFNPSDPLTKTITVTATDDPPDDPAQENPQNDTQNTEADANQEPPSDFHVLLSNPVNATLGNALGVGTIYDGVVPDNQTEYCNCMCSCGVVKKEVNKADGSLDAHDGEGDPNADLKQITADVVFPEILAAKMDK
jgi:hypothetical protein